MFFFSTLCFFFAILLLLIVQLFYCVCGYGIIILIYGILFHVMFGCISLALSCHSDRGCFVYFVSSSVILMLSCIRHKANTYGTLSSNGHCKRILLQSLHIFNPQLKRIIHNTIKFICIRKMCPYRDHIRNMCLPTSMKCHGQ